MYKYNLKCNPELAKERHRQQNREWYKRNKEYVMCRQRERRLEKRLMKQILVCEETHSLEEVWEKIRKSDYSQYDDLIKIETGKRMVEAFNNYHRYKLNEKDGK